MRAFVTGASGHVGANLVQHLLGHGWNVRCLVHRDTAALTDPRLELVRANLTDAAALRPLMAGVDAVFHAAACVAIEHADLEPMRTVNLGGTRAVCEAAMQAGVARLVHVSSIHVFDQYPLDRPLTDERPLTDGTSALPYAQTKTEAHRLVFDFCTRGLNACIVVPTAVVGPHDHKPSRMGQVICDLAMGRMPVVPRAGFNWVDARDVAQAAVACVTRGRAGTHYLVAGHWASFRDVANTIATAVGQRTTRLEVPLWTAYAAVPFTALLGRLTRRRPAVSLGSLNTLRVQCSDVRDDRARAELGHAPRPLADTLVDTLRWMAEAGRIDR